MRIFSAILFALLFGSFAICQDVAPEVRLWVSRVGNQYLKGRLVHVDGGVVVLKDESNRLTEVNLSDLSNEDRNYALQHAVQLENELPPPSPVPDSGDADVTAEPAKKIELPKSLRTLQRLLNASVKPNGDESDESGDKKPGYATKPMFGKDSSVFVALSGDFLNEFIRVPIEENQNVSDVILGTPVEGTAAMKGMATLMLKPSPTHASVEVVVSGRADTQTVGQQILLNVHSNGTTHFEARKGLRIGERGIELFAANATARSEVLGSTVSTELRGRLGSLVGRIGGLIVEAQRPEIDRAASEKAAYRAAKDLDARIDSEVARVQEVLTEIAPGLAKGEPAVPIRFRTTSNVLGILIGENEPEEWMQFDDADAKLEKDIMVVLPRKTVSTAQRLDMAMRLLSVSIEDQLSEIGMDAKNLTPTRESWSEDREWLTLEWDVDGSIVELLSKDFIKSTMAALPKSQPKVYQTPANHNVPSFNQIRRPRSNVFRPIE